MSSRRGCVGSFALLSTNRPATSAKSAERYLEREGYTPCALQIVRVEGTDWLVTGDAIGKYATKDLPLLMNRTLFRPGSYFCKRALVGGVSEFIDDDGTVQRLLFARWQSLR